MKARKDFTHIINPVLLPPQHELMQAQSITFASMKKAQQIAEKNDIQVRLLTTQYSEDHPIIPEYFTKVPDLERSILDIRSFTHPRKLPLIADIIGRLYANSDSPYLIYTNVDIGLLPNFYLRVAEWLDQGHDALIINRRRLPAVYTTPADLPAIYKDPGLLHPGFDCFVFRRELYTRFQLGTICVGIPFIGVTLAHHLFAFAQHPKLIDREYLTFHIGLEVMPPHDPEYYWHNRNNFRHIRDEHLWSHFDIRRFPYAELPLLKRYWRWVKNPSLFTFMNLRLEWRAYVANRL
ncbi:MAG TPA: hypothetical protein VJ953_17875 [Saprospiraceae bacterium]|nr:hypothetical protein [Saprospiraceae bacterium]